MTPRDYAEIPEQNSHLFIVRLWSEDLGNGQWDMRGKVQHVGSGEVRYFRNWQILESFMEGLLSEERAKNC